MVYGRSRGKSPNGLPRRSPSDEAIADWCGRLCRHIDVVLEEVGRVQAYSERRYEGSLMIEFV